jgi:hypothetical protein
VAERWVTPTVRFAWKRGAKTVLSGGGVYRSLAAVRVDRMMARDDEPGVYDAEVGGWSERPTHGRCRCQTRNIEQRVNGQIVATAVETEIGRCVRHSERWRAGVVARLAALYRAQDAKSPLHEAAPFDLSHFTADQLDTLQVAIDWHRSHGRHKPARRSRKPKP